ncbi:aldehyde dehydrogenase family protein [Pseudonocardia sp. H11422]|uniref:aldehyde dehydrogenase family protein n=1 Tax=Pseudonocardia sp. H11422 TaxID=2835866 RepID=UPI00202816C6|nr:aldehyde dehydrogenase family protein [Pseudonocardia sp. H11422]
MATRYSEQVQAFLARPHRLLVNGEWVPSSDTEEIPVLDPATGQIITRVAGAGARDVDLAVTAAHEALEDGPWRRMSARDRARLLQRLAGLVAEHAEEFAELEAIDAGKPLVAARSFDVEFSLRHLEYYAGWPTKIAGQTLPVAVPGVAVRTERVPVGVAGQIIPWNFPLLMAAWKLSPALAAGCTVVLKPSELTPLSALRLGELICEAGFPPGVVNIVPGTGPLAGAAIVEHPLVRKIAFTGSTAVGTSIAAAAAQTMKRVTLELGGKSPLLVFDDADQPAAVETALAAAFANAGQNCSAGSRLYVQEGVFEEFLTAFTARVTDFQLGHGLDEGVTMGPLISARQRDRVTGYITAAERSGARLLTGGADTPAGTDPAGFFVRPTVVTDVPQDAPIVQQEVFGPVVVALPFTDEADALAKADDTVYGLAAGVCTRDIGRANRVTARLRAGSVYVNTYGHSDAAAPYGGFKQSGLGRELGAENLDAYLETRTVWTSLS